MNIIEKQKLVKSFHELSVTLLGKGGNALSATFEFALLLFGNKKMFDNSRFNSEKIFVRKMVIAWFKENFQNEKDYHLEQDGKFFYLIKKGSLNLFRTYKGIDRSQNSVERQRLYGVLMGYPKSATGAWFMNHRLKEVEIGENIELLNFYEQNLLTEVLGEIFLWHFRYSREHWQSEYRFQIKEHVRIYELFPEIFLTDIQEDQEKVEYYNRVKSRLKKGNLLVKFSPLERFLFENIDFEWVQKRSLWNKKHKIISEFINMRHDTYKKMQPETAK